MSTCGESPSGRPLRPFALERFFAKYEFNPSVKYLACASDSEPLTLNELLQLADADSLGLWENLTLNYTESNGLPQLREEIANVHYSTVSSSQILVAAPQEAVFLTIHALIKPGDLVVCMHPAYQSLYEIAQSIGATVKMWHPRQASTNKTLTFDIEDLKALVVNQPVKLVVVNCPHNPTGWLPSASEWDAIRDCCTKSTYPGGLGAYLFSDEMYRGLELDPGSNKLPAGVDIMPPGRGISLSGLSKTVGLPGLRIGWIATTDAELYKAVATMKDYTTICCPAPCEILALMALKAWDVIVARQMEIIRTNLAIIDEYVNKKWKGKVFVWENAPKAGTVALLALFGELITEEGVEAFCAEVALKHGVLLLPGSVYDDNDDDSSSSKEEQQTNGEGRVRIGYGRKNLPEAVAALDTAFRAMKLIS
jgi:aspartate/methionine/tyrosine aminotransferase